MRRIVYELNPPKIVKGDHFDLISLNQDMKTLTMRARQLVGVVDGIHFTDSVLGIPRISSVTAAKYVTDNLRSLKKNSVKLSCSMRVRDRNFNSICQFVSDAIFADVDSVLVLMGDEPADKRDSGLTPSATVRMLRNEGYDARIKLNLSVPCKIQNTQSPSIQKKIAAKPYAFVTQSIESLEDLGAIADIAKPHGIRVVACIMCPAEKNRQSAAMIGLDWKNYEKNPVDFVKKAGKMTDQILLTSPNSFASGLELLKELK